MQELFVLQSSLHSKMGIVLRSEMGFVVEKRKVMVIGFELLFSAEILIEIGGDGY